MVRRLISVVPSAAADVILKLPRPSQRLNQEGQNAMLDELINPKLNGIVNREEMVDFGRFYIFEKKKMRNTVIIFLVLISPVNVIGQTTFSNAVEYNDYIVDQQTNVGNAINTLMGNLDFDSTTVWSYYNLGLATTKVSRDNIKNMPGYNNTTYFKEASLDLFEYYVEIFSKEFKEIVTLYLDNSIPLEQKLEKMSPVFDIISAKEVQYDANFANAQQKFATENNFDLIVSEPAEEE